MYMNCRCPDWKGHLWGLWLIEMRHTAWDSGGWLSKKGRTDMNDLYTSYNISLRKELLSGARYDCTCFVFLVVIIRSGSLYIVPVRLPPACLFVCRL